MLCTPIRCVQATAISAQGYGWPGAPALYTAEQTAGWAKVVASVKSVEGAGAFFAQV